MAPATSPVACDQSRLMVRPPGAWFLIPAHGPRRRSQERQPAAVPVQRAVAASAGLIELLVTAACRPRVTRAVWRSQPPARGCYIYWVRPVIAEQCIERAL